MVEDEQGVVGQLVEPVLTCSVTVNTRAMLEHLKAGNPALEKTAVFIVDKDFDEIREIKADFFRFSP